MKKLTPVIILCIALLIPQLVLSKEITDKSLNELMALSGINKQIAEFPGLIKQGVDQAKSQGAQLPDEIFNQLKTAIVNAFEPKTFLSTISKTIKAETTEEDAKKLLAWYKSKTGKLITQTEEKASTPEAYQEMMTMAQTLMADKGRLALINKMDNLTGGSEMILKLQEKSGLAVFTAMSKAMNPSQPVNAEAFMTQMNAQMQQMSAIMKQGVIIGYLYCYKDLDINIVKKYVNFMEQPHSAKFHKTTMNGIINGFNSAIDKMATSIAASMKPPAIKKL